MSFNVPVVPQQHATVIQWTAPDCEHEQRALLVISLEPALVFSCSSVRVADCATIRDCAAVTSGMRAGRFGLASPGSDEVCVCVCVRACVCV